MERQKTQNTQENLGGKKLKDAYYLISRFTKKSGN